jgi:hypothetical protein
MDRKTLTALLGSIKKWEDIIAGLRIDQGGSNCALCAAFPDAECRGCPVAKKTGQDQCNGTPYDEWRLALGQGRDLKGTDLYNGVGYNLTPEMKKAAEAERDFLISLLPAGVTHARD